MKAAMKEHQKVEKMEYWLVYLMAVKMVAK
jgi:hypothetical protein